MLINNKKPLSANIEALISKSIQKINLRAHLIKKDYLFANIENFY